MTPGEDQLEAALRASRASHAVPAHKEGFFARLDAGMTSVDEELASGAAREHRRSGWLRST